MDVAGMMYTKEGEFEVSLTGGSPWGFTIRTQSGNGLYNRARVTVAKVCTFENINQYLYTYIYVYSSMILSSCLQSARSSKLIFITQRSYRCVSAKYF